MKSEKLAILWWRALERSPARGGRWGIARAVLSTLVAAIAFGVLSGAASAATLTVCASGCDYTTIQAAVTAANPGDTISVAAGNYAVVGANINKALTLLGAQAGVDARNGRPAAPESIIAGSGFGTFHVSAANITFDGFTFSDLKGRELDSTTDADNFTMRNCILQGSSIDPGYNTGAIQFGGGLNLHANGLLFEQNLVTADNGQLFYMGHAMDNGTIRNNKFHGDTASFGPFGTRTGWLIEGNEFDGDVPGHGPYWGFGFNANLGDVIIRNNNVHKMSVGFGQISVVGGSITGNTFDDNQFAAFQLWGGEFGSVVSANMQIECNTIKYNGTACTGFADASHGIRLRVGLDASTIHMHDNNFTNLGVGTCGQAWAIRQNGSGTADAELNWWGTTNPVVIATMFGQGAVDFDPFLTAPVADVDNDGILDPCDTSVDQCPDDPNKTEPGQCGCGIPDTDTDGDGVADCVDNCPTVSNPDQRDTNGDGTGDACTAFQFPAGGLFVVGNVVNLTGGSTVNFWGSQWSQNNPMTGGSGPNAFKGFEDGTTTPTCGGTWTSRPGNSSNPPATVPQFMGVIVSSSIQKNGSAISGNVKKIIVIQTNPGYGPAPGKAGTGKVIAIICQ